MEVNIPRQFPISKFRKETFVVILSIWGETKTCKTTLALTFPKPLVHFEFDPGGLEWAAHKFVGEAITSTPYAVPIQLGVDKEGKGNRIPTLHPFQLRGIKELWYKVLADYNKALEDKSIQTIVMDTATQLQQIDRAGYLQEKQEAQFNPNGTLPPGEKLRQQLQQFEYTEPNARMRSIIYAVRIHKKNLVLVHFAADEYITRPNSQTGSLESVTSGKIILDGFKETERLVDMEIYTYTVGTIIKQQVIPNINQPQSLSPWGIIMKSGLGSISVVGSRIQEPTYDKIMKLVEMARDATVNPTTNGG